MSTKTDLAKEIIDRISPNYSKKRDFIFKNTKISEILIENSAESELFGKPIGKYVTVESDFPHRPFENFDNELLAISKELSKMLPKSGDILAVGLGNSFLTADSLGPMTAKMLFCGDFFGRKLLSLIPGVSGRTGIEPRILISAAVEKLSPKAVILIDSLVSENIENVCKTIQLCNSGISPGSGIFAEKDPINETTLDVPVIAIGTPTVTRLSEGEFAFVSPNDIDILIKRSARLVAAAISLGVFPEAGSSFIKGIMI